MALLDMHGLLDMQGLQPAQGDGGGEYDGVSNRSAIDSNLSLLICYLWRVTGRSAMERTARDAR